MLDKTGNPQNLFLNGTRQRFPVGTQIFLQGEIPNDVYFIREGLVKMVRTLPDGHDCIVAVRQAGQTIGVWSVILNRPYALTAVAVTSCEFLRLSSQDFMRMVEQSRDHSGYILRSLSEDIYDYISQVAELSWSSARLRLEHFIGSLALSVGIGSQDGSVRLYLPFKHWEVAQLLAVTPTYLSRLLTEIETDGLIRRSGGAVIIPDVGKLWSKGRS